MAVEHSDGERNGRAGRRGRLFVLVGPSGVGKGTLRVRALSDVEGLVYSISCTTREPRENERDGVEYYFISQEEFKERLARGAFLEHAAVHTEFYGTPRENVRKALEAGRDVILEIDVQGAAQIRSLVPDCVLIFIAPPSLPVLERRLRLRHTESEGQIRLRLENAEKEMAQSAGYDHLIVNDELNLAAAELRDIILSYRHE